MQKGFFNEDFYPTSQDVYDMMGVDCEGLRVLEPQAGSGNIVKFLNDGGAKKVYAIEKNDDLRTMLGTKNCEIIGSDCLEITREQISHIQLIVSNPPFSEAEKHINHLFDIAPAGCEIVALCNYKTISETYYNHNRKKLVNTISNYGSETNIGAAFAHADRMTTIDIGLIKLYKPMVDGDSINFEDFYLETELEGNSSVSGVMTYDEITATVQRYVASLRAFDDIEKKRQEINMLTNELGMPSISFSASHDNNVTTKSQFAKSLQKNAWKMLFEKFNLSKFVTRDVMADINKFVEVQEKVPFTKKNIYKMFEIIIGTRETTYKRAIVSALDKFTKHTKVNRFDVEGFVTNGSGALLTRKFIVTHIVEPYWGSSRGESTLSLVHSSYGSRYEYLDDLTKVLCNLKGVDYAETYINDEGKKVRRYEPFYNFFSRMNDHRAAEKANRPYTPISSGKLFEWGLFTFKAYKKGTMHITFKNEYDWALINRAYGEAKGFPLPETTFSKKKKRKTKK